LDVNGEGTIDTWELENATKLLRKLDRNGDGQPSPVELGLRPHEGDHGRRGAAAHQPAQQ
jgi:hypothetical protein